MPLHVPRTWQQQKDHGGCVDHGDKVHRSTLHPLVRVNFVKDLTSDSITSPIYMKIRGRGGNDNIHDLYTIM